MGSDGGDQLWDHVRARLSGKDPVPEQVRREAYQALRQRFPGRLTQSPHTPEGDDDRA